MLDRLAHVAFPFRVLPDDEEDCCKFRDVGAKPVYPGRFSAGADTWSPARAATISVCSLTSNCLASAKLKPRSARLPRLLGRLIFMTSVVCSSPSAPTTTTLKTRPTCPLPPKKTDTDIPPWA